MTKAKDDPNWHKGRCIKCKKKRTKKGHDPCIADLPGVEFACCGHGTGDGYIAFENGLSIYMDITGMHRRGSEEFERW
jgi:hypothetical protein